MEFISLTHTIVIRYDSAEYLHCNFFFLHFSRGKFYPQLRSHLFMVHLYRSFSVELCRIIACFGAILHISNMENHSAATVRSSAHTTIALQRIIWCGLTILVALHVYTMVAKTDGALQAKQEIKMHKSQMKKRQQQDRCSARRETPICIRHIQMEMMMMTSTRAYDNQPHITH